MNHHGDARLTILLGMEPRIQEEYTVVKDAKTIWGKLTSAYKSKLKLHIFRITEEIWSIKQQNCWDVDDYTSQIDPKVKDYNLCAGPSTTAIDTNMDSAKTNTRMSEQECIFYLLCGIPRNDEWRVFLELMMDKNAMMTTTPKEIVTKLVEKEAAIKEENWLAPEPLLCAMYSGNAGRGSSGGRSLKMDKRYSKNDRNENDLPKCFHCQRQ